ncbi:MAG: Nucleoside-diphosphate-sugar epimerase [Candidatus Paceibacter sp.]|jgi:dTDP-glucose 4,6-dehydratase|nr:Nucleoside-diphosphate-sugar epimerase [Candidatus Paceibacter sp.]
MANILVTGSRGVVGSYLMKMLTEKGHSVFGIDLYHAYGETGWEHEMAKNDFTYARCDVADYRQLERVFEKAGPFEFVYHTAAEFGRWNGEDYYEQVWRSNAIGTKNIIRLQEKLGFKLIHFSSSEVYGDYEDVMKEDVMDTVEIKQMNDYAMSKWVNEMQIRNSAIKNGTKSVVVRLFNTYGPGEWYHPYRSVNAKFCYHALHGIPVTVYKGHYRTSTYLEDTCRTLTNISDNFIPGEVYNIGGDEYHDIETLAKIIWDYTGADPKLIEYKDSEVLTTKSKKVDISKAKKDLKHELTISLEDGVKKTIDWMRSYYGKQ